MSTAFKEHGYESVFVWSPAEGNTLQVGRKMNADVAAASAELFHLARNEADMAVTVAPVNESQFHGVLQTPLPSLSRTHDSAVNPICSCFVLR